MKGTLSVLLCIFFLFGLVRLTNADNQGDGQQVMKELDDFQKALSSWMKNLDNLGSQFAALQKKCW